MLPSLKYRRMRGDMIKMYTIIHRIDDLDWKDFFVKTETDRTRYSGHKFYVKYSRSKKIKNVFSMITVPIWIALCEVTRDALTLNMLKNILDSGPSFFCYMYDYDA